MMNVFLLKRIDKNNQEALCLSNTDQDFIHENTTYNPAFEITGLENGGMKHGKLEFEFTTLNNDFKIGDLIEISKIVRGQKIIVFSGEALGIFQNDDASLRVKCINLIQKLLQKRGEFFSANCRAQLGDVFCKKDLSQFSFTGKVKEVTGTSSFKGSHYTPKPDYFFGGYVEFKTGKLSNQKFYITKTQSNIVFTIQALNLLKSEDEYIIVAGCDKRFKTCIEKFNNIENFRGEPFLDESNT